MAYNLIVSAEFGIYKKGDRITDAHEVARLDGSAMVLRVSSPDAAPIAPDVSPVTQPVTPAKEG